MINRTLVILLALTCNIYARGENLKIKLSGNAYVTQKHDGAQVGEQGLTKWTDATSVISIYFYLHQPEKLQLSLNASGHSVVSLTYEGKQQQVKLSSDQLSVVPAADVNIKSAGYARIDIKGVKKEGETFGEISDLIIGGLKGNVSYVTNFSDYWGRRGPSVHLAYTLPEQPTEWFYTEIRVPKVGEVMHSYYMATGFGEGYFGMQFNSPTERRILFSVWSPFDTQDPKLIPQSDRIRMLRRGEGVHIGEFGNEGSGGQSYLRYPWRGDETYKFLMHVRPDDKGNTIYTAYFFATEEGQWRLVASFLRPKTDTWYTRAHSFLENFNPEQGYLPRQVEFTNQWARGTDSVWRQVSQATFTHDATAKAGVRRDYQGGLVADSSAFYLKMGGFFNESTPLRSQFELETTGVAPNIDLEELEKL